MFLKIIICILLLEEQYIFLRIVELYSIFLLKPATGLHHAEIRQFILRVESHYGGYFHDYQQRQRVEALLGQFCQKIRTIPGCVTAIVNLFSPSKLMDMLRDISSLAKEIKGEIFATEKLTDIFKLRIESSSSIEGQDKVMVEKLMTYAIERLHVQIGVTSSDILNFLDDNKRSLDFVIQARIAPTETPTVKPNTTVNSRFLGRFDKHPEFQTFLQEILSGQSISGFSRLSMATGEKVCSL